MPSTEEGKSTWQDTSNNSDLFQKEACDGFTCSEERFATKTQSADDTSTPSLLVAFARLLRLHSRSASAAPCRTWVRRTGPGNMGRPRLTRGPPLVLGVGAGFVSFLVSTLHHFFLGYSSLNFFLIKKRKLKSINSRAYIFLKYLIRVFYFGYF